MTTNLDTIEPADTSDLDDLDSLLIEALELQTARAAKARGGKLTEDQAAALSRAKVAEEAANWQIVANVACFCRQFCTKCGSGSHLSLGWYRYTKHVRRAGESKLERIAQPGPGPLRQHLIHEEVTVCFHCLSLETAPYISVKELPILSSIGLTNPAPFVLTEEKFQEQSGTKVSGEELLKELEGCRAV